MIRRLPGFSHYWITRDGEIYSQIKKRHLRPFSGANGYRQITLKRDDGVLVRLYVHRIIAQLFVPNPLNKPDVNHINGIRSDNRVENLEWVTHAENMQHAARVGLRKAPKGVKVRGAKLTMVQLREIVKLLEQGVYQEEIGKMFGVSDSTICEINTGKRYIDEVRAIRNVPRGTSEG